MRDKRVKLARQNSPTYTRHSHGRTRRVCGINIARVPSETSTYVFCHKRGKLSLVPQAEDYLLCRKRDNYILCANRDKSLFVCQTGSLYIGSRAGQLLVKLTSFSGQCLTKTMYETKRTGPKHLVDWAHLIGLGRRL